MLYRLLDRDQITRPIALLLIALGLFLIAFSLIFHQYPALHSGLSSDHADFAMGFFVGLAIVIEIAGIGAVISGRRSTNGAAGPQA
jgi:hypothetical protein